MKIISTLLIALLCVNFNLNAQNSCANPQVINPGTYTVTDVAVPGQVPNPECADNFGGLRTSGRWFQYTSGVDGVATVSSSLAQNSNTDTRFHVYTGTCSTLACLAGNDDADVFGGVKTSEVTFPVSNGTTYYIAWDNRWSSDGFDFILTETAVSCSNGILPINEDFDDPNSFVACLSLEDTDSNGTSFKQIIDNIDGSGPDEDFASNGSNSNSAKDDWLFSTPIDLISGHEYIIDFKYNGANGSFTADENLDVYFIDAPSSGGNVLSTLFSDSGITLNGGTYAQAETNAFSESVSYTSTATGTYYLAFNATSNPNTGSLLLFDYSVSDNTLGASEFNLDGITNVYNKANDILSISSKNIPLNRIEIFDILGQKVLSRELSKQVEKIDLANLLDGIYIIRVSSSETSMTTKLLKQ